MVTIMMMVMVSVTMMMIVMVSVADSAPDWRLTLS